MSAVHTTRHWVVAGGGTGGHVTPALALAERIRARGDEVLLLGSTRGLESRLVPEAGFELCALPAQPVYGRSLAARLQAAPAMARACASAWRALGAFEADFVISVGGYASVPAVVGAALRRVPVALVEPNAIPGRANRAAARFALRIFVQFEVARAGFPASAAPRVCDIGIPLRETLVAGFAERAERRKPERPFRVFVFGGSQGARQINDAMIEASALFEPGELEIHHQTGDADRERVEQAYRAAGLQAEAVAFERDMRGRYRWADLALCRAGALTVAELALAGLPSLLVPYPFAADDHQAANAAALLDAGAARVLDERPLPGASVVGALRDLFAAPERLLGMGRSAAALARPHAAEQIIENCAALASARDRRAVGSEA